MRNRTSDLLIAILIGFGQDFAIQTILIQIKNKQV